MIEAYVGIPGSGKSYALVYRGLWALARGRRLYANFGFIRENVYLWLRKRARFSHREAVLRADSIREIRSYSELLDVVDGFLLFDEAHMWLPSRLYEFIPVEVIAFWSQHRKVGVDVLLATQRYGSVDAIVRELVAFVHWVRPSPFWLDVLLLPIARGRKVMRYTVIMDDTIGTMTRRTSNIFESVMKNSFFILDPMAARCYDTHAIFEPPVVQLQRELDPRKRSVFEKMGLRWDFSRVRFRPAGMRSMDGFPVLSFSQYAEAYRRGVSPSSLLSSYFADPKAWPVDFSGQGSFELGLEGV